MHPIFNPVPGEYISLDDQARLTREFEEGAVEICRRHLGQTAEEVKALVKKYAEPREGARPIIQWLEQLALCVDPSDVELGCVSQLTHSLQVAGAMRRDGWRDELVVVGLVHDLGKLLLLKGEPAHNVTGPNEPIGVFDDNIGLDNIVTTWNHDEFIYQRLGRYFAPDAAWLLRYHSVRTDKVRRYMCDFDRKCETDLLGAFRRYDLQTKSTHGMAEWGLEAYHEQLLAVFPDPVFVL